jgi:UDP-N-acetylmuramate: L-alanyl-gamma-D-glutamyl-meso-diaminopimelate ligase
MKDGVTSLITEQGLVSLQIFGDHNLQNLMAAYHVCQELGIQPASFYHAISSFRGAARRLEPVRETTDAVIYKDFAHSPSKLKATTNAFKKQFPERELIACMELHTFSSLNAQFLSQYKNSMALADQAFVYFNPHTIEHKRLTPITAEQVKDAFGTANVKVYTSSSELMDELKRIEWRNRNLLLMTSGNFDGVDFNLLADQLLSKVS